MQATSVKRYVDADSAAVKGERILAAPAARPHSTILLGLVFPWGRGPFSSWPTWRCPPGCGRSGEEAGESSSVEQILDDVPQVGPDDLAFPMGNYQFYTRRGGTKPRRGRIGALFSKRRISASL
jgi:hypothetical protein